MTPLPAPTMTPSDADALEAYWWWPYWVEDEVEPDYSDVNDG